jgi:hypothetical protein
VHSLAGILELRVLWKLQLGQQQLQKQQGQCLRLHLLLQQQLLLLLAWNLPRFARSAAPSVLTVHLRALSNQLVSMLLQQLQH